LKAKHASFSSFQRDTETRLNNHLSCTLLILISIDKMFFLSFRKLCFFVCCACAYFGRLVYIFDWFIYVFSFSQSLVNPLKFEFMLSHSLCKNNTVSGTHNSCIIEFSNLFFFLAYLLSFFFLFFFSFFFLTCFLFFDFLY